MFNIIPYWEEENRFVFITGSTSTWQTFTKPAGISFVNILAIGGGAGGSQGTNTAAPTSGGGGGGSGAIMSVTYAASYLPDCVFIQVGNGGAGSTSHGTVGSAGGTTYVSIQPLTTASYLLALANPGNPGANFSAAGIAGVVTTTITCPNITSAISYNLLAGVAGGAGATTAANAASLTALSSHVLTGGTGGGYFTGTVAYNGGDIIGAGIIPTVPGGIFVGSGDTDRSGNAGVWFWKPLCGTGGTGGASSGSSASRLLRGGNGAYGCGGGGGGAGTSYTDATLKTGGNGGSGLVIITCW